jgi:Ca2+-transporting ATPase
MLQRYIGLTLGQVYENRKRFGANVVSPLMTINWSNKLHSLTSFWFINLLEFIALFVIFLLPILDLFRVDLSINAWSILFILPIIAIVVFFSLLLYGNYDNTQGRYVVDNKMIVYLLILLFFTMLTYLQTLYMPSFHWYVYIESFVLAAYIILLALIHFLLEMRQIYSARKKEEKDDFSSVCVIRDGQKKQVLRREIVVADIILLHSGDSVPADAELLEATDLVVNEYLITGKSISMKSLDPMQFDYYTQVPMNHVLRGSVVLQGEAVAKVFAVGKHTIQAEKLNLHHFPIKQRSHNLVPSPIHRPAFSI